MTNILTLEEAMSSLQTDNDFDNRIKNALPAIDAEIFIGTGIKWQNENPIFPLAKKVAEIKLRISLDMSTNPEQDKSREIYYMKQLQAEAIMGSRFIDTSDENGGNNAESETGGTYDHAKLIHLGFKESKHEGFASIEDISVSNLLFMAMENNIAVLTPQMPMTNQILLPMSWFAAEPEMWRDILTLTPISAIGSQYFEIIENNRFSAKLFLNSDVARTAARIRLQLIDIADNALLATATQIVDFPAMNTINVPILFEGFYQTVRRVPLSRIRLVISVMTSLFGFQIRLISNPPNEISFISKTSTTIITEEQIRDIVYEILRRQEG